MRVNIEKEPVEANETTQEKKWLHPIDVEEIYGWSRSWQAKARMSSSKVQLPFKKIGKFIIYSKAELDAFVEKHTIVGGE